MAVTDKLTAGQYRYSFSGADARAYAYYEGFENNLCILESLQTVSISIHEAKGQARSLGYRNVKGFSRGIRTNAGSMIMTVIEDHPLRGLVSTVSPYLAIESSVWGGWSFDRGLDGTGSALDGFDFNNRIAPLLPPFNILLTYVSEGAQFAITPLVTEDIRFGVQNITSPALTNPSGASVEQNLGGTTTAVDGAGVLLQGVEIIDSSMVTSVNDIVSEMSFSFFCRDVKPLAKLLFTQNEILARPTEEQVRQESLLKRLFGKKDPVDRYNRQQNKAVKQLDKEGKNLGLTQEEIDRQKRGLLGLSFGEK